MVTDHSVGHSVDIDSVIAGRSRLTADQALTLYDGATLHELGHWSSAVCERIHGDRLRTYVIPGDPGSGEICINGAAAHLVKPHDKVIIASYVQVEDAQAAGWEARRVFVDDANRPRE